MRILFLSQLLPLPLDAGPKIRAYYVLRHLVAAGHHVKMLCFVRPSDRRADIEALRSLCGTVDTVPLRRSRMRDVQAGLNSLIGGTPFLIQRDRMPAMSARLEQLLASDSFDAVHADQLWMAPYASACNVGLKVLDQHNAVFKVPERLARHHPNPVVRTLLRREAARLEAFEHETCESFDRVVWVSADDREAFPFDGRHPHAQHAVIPIAVDPLERQPVSRTTPFRVTFLGGMHWPPNAEGARWFAEHCWPRIAQEVPDAVLTVIGKGRLSDLAGRGAANRVVVTGYVADLERYLAETAVFIVPLLTGAGMRVKILDAWCWGVPVVSTAIGAEGIQVHHGDNILVADEPEAFAAHVVDVLRQPTLSKRVGEGGRATVEALYDWRKVYRAWDRVYH
ncbi:MAG: glycosyltransferase family 4 protein [Vicinamibacterales bacterium]